MKNGSDVLNAVAGNTSSEIVLLAIVIAVVIIIVAIPIYRTMVKSKKETLDQYIKREELLIKVIQGNTEVNSELKQMLATNNQICAQCKEEHQDQLIALGEKIDTHNDKLVEVHTMLKTRTCLMIGRKEGE